MSLPVLGQPFGKAVCPTHQQEVGLNRNGHCPYCFITARGGKPNLSRGSQKPRREACPKCGDTRPHGKFGCPGCHAKQRQVECGEGYTKRGIQTALPTVAEAMETHASYGEAMGLHQDTRPANERWPAFEIGFENPQPEPDPQLSWEIEEGEFIGPIYDDQGVRRA